MIKNQNKIVQLKLVNVFFYNININIDLLNNFNFDQETLTQTDSIKTLKQMCKDQENTINQLKNDLTLLREERETETETFSTQVNIFYDYIL